MFAGRITLLALSILMGSLLGLHADLTFGVCAHPIPGREPWKDPAKQLETLRRYGLTTYRFDVFLTDDQPNVAEEVESLLRLADPLHITLHPVLLVPFCWGDNATDNGKYPNTEAGLEMQGCQRVRPIIERFGSRIRDWELCNEVNLIPGVKAKDASGLSRVDFDTPKGRQWAAVLRGMARAVHEARVSGDVRPRTVVDTTYINFPFIEFLESRGVVIDKLAYHYYYKVENSPYQIDAPNGTKVNIFAEMKRLGKPVIINEFNAAEIYTPIQDNKPYDDAKALASVKKHLDFIQNQTEANIEGIEFYELYNEPKKDAAESNFGLMLDANHPRLQMLLAALYTGATLTPEESKQLADKGLFKTTPSATTSSVVKP